MYVCVSAPHSKRFSRARCQHHHHAGERGSTTDPGVVHRHGQVMSVFVCAASVMSVLFVLSVMSVLLVLSVMSVTSVVSSFCVLLLLKVWLLHHSARVCDGAPASF